MKKSIKNTLLAVAGTAISMIPGAAVFAQGTGSIDLQPVQSADITSILDRVINFILGIAGGIAVIYLIWAGIQYITGGAKGAAAAKDAIVNAIIGIVVILLSYVIINAVITAIGG